MLLERMNAVIYGGGGTIGGAVAAAFAREGADRAPRRAHPRHRWSGSPAGSASTVARPPSPRSMRSTRRRSTPMPMPWSRDHGTLDISMNLISSADVQGTPLVEMAIGRLRASDPPRHALDVRHCAGGRAPHDPPGLGRDPDVRRRGDPIRDYNIGGFQISLTAVEALRKQLASELGRHGVRVVSLLTGGVIDSIPADFEGRDGLVESLVAPTLLGRGAMLEDVGNVAAFAASDRARTITARRSTSPAARSSPSTSSSESGISLRSR